MPAMTPMAKRTMAPITVAIKINRTGTNLFSSLEYDCLTDLRDLRSGEFLVGKYANSAKEYKFCKHKFA